jgi:PAP2 superfamily
MSVIAEERAPSAPLTGAEGRPATAGRGVAAGVVVAAVTLGTALVATQIAGVALRDPKFVTGRRLAIALGLVALLIVVDVVLRARRQEGTPLPSLATLRRVRRERWTPARTGAVLCALVAFHVTYLAYRNIKSVVPLLRPGDLFDRELADLDRSLFLGHDPAALLHSLWGTGISTDVLSAAYLLFFAFIPVTLALALVFSRDLRNGLFYVTALSITWALGAVSYVLVPALGPIYVEPEAFAALPTSGVAEMQAKLLGERVAFLRDPAATAQSIGAFASLHTAIVGTAVGAAHMLGAARAVKVGLWLALALTVGATIHFGWHYVVDDIAGALISVAALALTRVLTGAELRGLRPVPEPTPSAGTSSA